MAADLAEANVPKNAFKRWLKTIAGNEQCVAYKYVHRLRKTEYYLNTGKKLLYHWSHFLQCRLGLKLGIRIVPNKVGKGLNIIHLAGGGAASSIVCQWVTIAVCSLVLLSGMWVTMNTDRLSETMLHWD